jgi:cytochrome bd-type quinol oxidase subunit 2
MLREIAIILLAISCVLLYLPLFWIIPSVGKSFVGPVLASIPILLLSMILVYAIYNTKKLFERNKSENAMLFILVLIGAIVLSIVAVTILYPYVTPKFMV